MKARYDISKLERQWLAVIAAALLLAVLMFVAFFCFYQAFALVNKNSIGNPPASNSIKRGN